MNKTVATVFIPIGLGVVAALFNLMAVRSATSTVDLTVVTDDVKAGTPLTEGMLDRLTVRADKDVFKSAVRYEDRGVLVGRPANRPLAAREVVLLADIRLSGTFDVRANLRPGERSLTLAVKPARIVPGLRVGDEVEVVLSGGGDHDPPGDPQPGDPPLPKGVGRGRTVGPFRVVGLGERQEATAGAFRSDDRQVVIAYAAAQTGTRDFAALERAYRREGGESVVGVEYARDKPPAQ